MDCSRDYRHISRASTLKRFHLSFLALLPVVCELFVMALFSAQVVYDAVFDLLDAPYTIPEWTVLQFVEQD